CYVAPRRLLSFPTRRSSDLPMDERSLKSRPRGQAKKPVEPPVERQEIRADSVDFWRDLARAGSESCADELSPDDLSKLHVAQPRSEEHTSELQSREHLVCRL